MGIFWEYFEKNLIIVREFDNILRILAFGCPLSATTMLGSARKKKQKRDPTKNTPKIKKKWYTASDAVKSPCNDNVVNLL